MLIDIKIILMPRNSWLVMLEYNDTVYLLHVSFFPPWRAKAFD